MEKLVSEVNNASDSFSYELHQHYKCGWKHIFNTKNQLVE